MRICAVDLKNNEANLCLLEQKEGLFNLPDCRARKFTLINPLDSQAVIDFQKQFIKLVEDYKIEKIVIRERMTQGKFAGSAVSFKIEALLQLMPNTEAEVFLVNEIKQVIKDHPVLVPFKELGLKQFQEQAFITGYAYLNRSAKKVK